MSRIDQLIQELCPDGVEFVTLESVAKTITGLTGKTKADFSDGNARFVTYKNAFSNLEVDDAASDFVKVEEGERQNLLRFGDVVITGSSENVDEVGMSSVVVREPVEPLYLNSFCFALRFKRPALLPEFSKYLFRGEAIRKQIRKAASGVTRINVSKPRFMKIRIPMPPLEVQREIVRVLDKFTQLEAELEAELEARRAQYAHYRLGLLSFDIDQVESVAISEGFETRNGYTPAKSDPTNWVNGTVPWFRMEDIRENGRVLSRALQMIPEKAVKGGRCFPANSLIFATSATIGEHALVTVPYMSNQRFTALWPNAEYADRFDMKFLFHYGFVIGEWCRNNTTTSSFASVDMGGFKRLQIPIPSLEEQRRIAAQLDRFDALVNDISIGLPAELAARRKQYEYYRDRLLTFKERAA